MPLKFIFVVMSIVQSALIEVLTTCWCSGCPGDCQKTLTVTSWRVGIPVILAKEAMVTVGGLTAAPGKPSRPAATLGFWMAVDAYLKFGKF